MKLLPAGVPYRAYLLLCFLVWVQWEWWVQLVFYQAHPYFQILEFRKDFGLIPYLTPLFRKGW